MSENVSSAVALFRAGKLFEAEQVCQRLFTRDPNDPDLLNLLGIMASSNGNGVRAVELMRKSVALNPSVLEHRKNLARALLQHGSAQEAESVLRNTMATTTGGPDLGLLWGAILARCGKLDEGIQFLERASELYPKEAAMCYRLANLHRRRKDFTNSIRYLKMALEIQPRFAEALNDLAGLQMAQGQFFDSLQTIQRLLAVNPRSAQAYCNLAALLGAAGDFSGGELALRNALALQPDSARARFQLAKMLAHLGKFEEAEALVRELRSMQGHDSAPAKTLQAMILERRGDIRGAVEIIESLGANDSTNVDVATLRAILLEQQGEYLKAVEVLETAVQSSQFAAVEGIGLYFILGQLYDTLGRYDEAFAAYERGNENRKSAFIKSPLAEQNATPVSEKLRCFYEPTRFRDCPVSNQTTEQPIFIVGMPRSGTTLTEQILDGHSGVYGAGELTALHDCVHATYRAEKPAQNSFEVIAVDPSGGKHCLVPAGWENIQSSQLMELGNCYLRRIPNLSSDVRRFTDKMPYNFYLTGFIAKVFPNARIIHCKRHPLDTCLSCYFQNFATGSQFAFDLKELGEFYREYEEIMAFWRTGLSIPMLEVDYESLVENPEFCARQIIEYCGLEWEPDCLNIHKSQRVVSTASYQQVRQPIYTKSVGRWRNYVHHLGPLIDSLGIQPSELK